VGFVVTGMELVADGLVKRLGSTMALDGVSFKLEGRGCFGYLGPNGAGKTTTMKLFTNLLRPTKGKATIDGVEVSREPATALKAVGSLVEEPEPYSFMTVRQFMAFAARIRNRSVDETEMKSVSDRLDLPPSDMLCSKLSKGLKRRVFLGALLVQGTNILLLDEPTAGLDPAESVVFRNILLELKKERLIFLSSHMLFEVTQVCDSVIFLKRGKIIETGAVEDLTRKYTSKALRVEFSGRVQTEALEKLKAEGVVSSFEVEGERLYLFRFDGREETRKSLVDGLYPLGVRNIYDAQLGLEQAYMELMK
jgi:ABC-2 type transport system ATP-binding protein